MTTKPKGLPKTGGRKKGSVNKISSSVKDMLLGALDDVGGQEYFRNLALENPVAFASLIKHITPQETKIIEVKQETPQIEIIVTRAKRENKPESN